VQPLHALMIGKRLDAIDAGAFELPTSAVVRILGTFEETK
jgi:hypothetical protein